MKNTKSSSPPQVFQALWPDPPPGWLDRFGFYAIAQDGTVFLPAIAVDQPDNTLLLSASFDGEPLLIVGDNTPLFRSDWLKDNYPRKANQVDFVLNKIQSPQWQAKLLPQPDLS